MWFIEEHLWDWKTSDLKARSEKSGVTDFFKFICWDWNVTGPLNEEEKLIRFYDNDFFTKIVFPLPHKYWEGWPELIGLI